MADLPIIRVDGDDGNPLPEDGIHPIDDLAIKGSAVDMFRFERMSDSDYWGAIYFHDGASLNLSITMEDGKIQIKGAWDR